jgi:hypothetical protein
MDRVGRGSGCSVRKPTGKELGDASQLKALGASRSSRCLRWARWAHRPSTSTQSKVVVRRCMTGTSHNKCVQILSERFTPMHTSEFTATVTNGATQITADVSQLPSGTVLVDMNGCDYDLSGETNAGLYKRPRAKRPCLRHMLSGQVDPDHTCRHRLNTDPLSPV